MDSTRKARKPQQGGALRLYFDSNVIVDILRSQQGHACVDLLQEARARGWRCTASYFAIMEALDVEQENKWAKQKVRSNHDFQWIVRRRRQRELKRTSLTQVANQFTQRFFVELKNAISWVPLDERVWEEAVSLAAHTNVTATDCIHLATALAQECDLLVTADDPLINAAKERIAVAKPEQVLKALRGAQAQS